MVQNSTIPAFLDASTIGRTTSNVFVDYFSSRDPTSNDVNFQTQKKWLNTTKGTFWELENFTTSQGVVTANWIKIGSVGLVETLTGNDSIAVPATANNINLVGDGTYIHTTGVAATSTMTISPAGGIPILFTENTGTASASAGNVNVFGTGSVNTVGSGNTITISASGINKWVAVSTNQSMVINQGYFLISPGGTLTMALPTTSSIGDTVRIALRGATSFEITQAAGQQIFVSDGSTTVGVGGSVTSTGTGDCIELVCETANTTWVAVSYIGNLTIV